MKKVTACLINNRRYPPIQRMRALILCRVEGWYPYDGINKIPQNFIVNTHWRIASTEKIAVVCVGTFSFSKKPEIMVHWHRLSFLSHTLLRPINTSTLERALMCLDSASCGISDERCSILAAAAWVAIAGQRY